MVGCLQLRRLLEFSGAAALCPGGICEAHAAGRTSLSRSVLNLRKTVSRGDTVRMMATATKLSSPQEELLDGVDVFIFDCDGVIWKGDSLIDGGEISRNCERLERSASS